jgi:hypothetical protein
MSVARIIQVFLLIYTVSSVAIVWMQPAWTIFVVIGAGIVGGRYSSVVIHEFGHYVVGRFVGLQFVELRAVIFVFRKMQDGKYNLSFSPNYAAAECMMYGDVEEQPDVLKKKRAYHTFGGPLFNLLFGSICLLVFLVNSNEYIDYVACLFFIFHYIDGLGNLYPKGAENSDGAKLAAWRKGTKEEEIDYYEFVVHSLLYCTLYERKSIREDKIKEVLYGAEQLMREMMADPNKHSTAVIYANLLSVYAILCEKRIDMLPVIETMLEWELSKELHDFLYVLHLHVKYSNDQLCQEDVEEATRNMEPSGAHYTLAIAFKSLVEGKQTIAKQQFLQEKEKISLSLTDLFEWKLVDHMLT